MLAAGVAGAAAVTLPSRVRPAGLDPRAWARAAAAKTAFRKPLRIPPVLSASQLEIEMREAKVAVLPGKKTKMWTYGGSFPGPTIRRPAGERTEVSFVHSLPAKAGELTVHLHGGHNRSSEDGQPGGLTARQPRALYCDISSKLAPADSGNDLLIAPGGRRTYTYDLIEDGGPERAAFQWYHDHRLERTAPNIWRGLAGMMIIDDAFEASLPLPTGDRDIPLMIVDRSFDKRNQLTNPFTSSGGAPDDGIVGRLALVNGVHLPFHRVAAARYRVRVLNAANFSLYNLELSNGDRMTQIATESGLMPAPLRRKKALIGPGERIELILDFTKLRGKRVVLQSARRKTSGGIASKTHEGPLIEFRVGGPLADPTSVPASLRPLPGWTESANQQPDRKWEFTISKGLVPSWLVNGKTFDPARADASPKLGTTETWELHNRTAVAHLIHMHHTDWYMLSRNGKAPAAHERCLKETFLLDPGERIVVAGHFSDFTGKYAIHCHMLDHEDHGLMSQFEVVA
ncbi:MAG: multicopper oxidase family protein [Solirubrobacterales bacterium]